ncbi:hypothetical protein SALBM135S_01667 [Streptomyces alboniger]
MGRRRRAYRSSGLRRPGGWWLLCVTAAVAGAAAVVLALLREWLAVALVAGLGAALTAAVGPVVERLRELESWPGQLAKARPGRVPRVREVTDPADWLAQAGRRRPDQPLRGA